MCLGHTLPLEKIRDSTQDLLNTSLMLLSLSHLDPWQRSGTQDALPRGLSRIPTDSHSMQGWTELKLWLNFATFKGSVVTRVVPLAVLVAGWWWKFSVYSRTTSSYTSDQNHIPVLVIVHECGWQILFRRIANPPYPCSQTLAAFVRCRNAARVLTQPRPHICVLNQRDLKKIEEHTLTWRSTATTRVTVAAAIFDALVAVAANFSSRSPCARLRKVYSTEGPSCWKCGTRESVHSLLVPYLYPSLIYAFSTDVQKMG